MFRFLLCAVYAFEFDLMDDLSHYQPDHSAIFTGKTLKFEVSAIHQDLDHQAILSFNGVRTPEISLYAALEKVGKVAEERKSDFAMLSLELEGGLKVLLGGFLSVL